ncbi:Alcohol dehydrogenase transcription factor Myb/SANT-like [Popillia japonica]|uniref:Alcohol dehydrogenase transcription factor Myb/SANT-like n=1 Tax=Popillia japonica TaxID=7064 RepID=A0AAW1JGV0_POPJA
MKDESDFNILFVSLIENEKALYDYTCADYSNRNAQDRAWESIAKEVSESVCDCKERWKNLRACYSRYLKTAKLPSGSGTRRKKPYYLAEFLSFLEPFTKSRKQSEDDEQNANIDSPSSIQLEESAFSDISVSDATTTKSTLLSEQSITAIPPMKVVKLSKVSIDDVNKAALEFFNARTSKKPVEAENPDLNFF